MFEFLKSISAKNPNRGRGPEKPAVSVRERVSALRHLPAFLKLIWQTSPALSLANIGLRLVRAGLPLAQLYVARLILDDVVALSRLPAGQRVLGPLFALVALEFGLVLLADANAPIGKVIRHNIDRSLRDHALDVGQPAQEALFDNPLNVGLGDRDPGRAQVAAQLIDHLVGNVVCAHAAPQVMRFA